MIHISRSEKNGQFYVVTKARNGEVLNVSETFPQKVKAWKNIAAASKNYRTARFNVQDDTLKAGPIVYLCKVRDGVITTEKTTNKPLPIHHS